jgi:molybdopterin synthase catalytic subunit
MPAGTSADPESDLPVGLSSATSAPSPDAPDPDTWLGLGSGTLPVDEVTRWVGRPDCGAVVVFTGNARDHSEGRVGVSALEYEAYESQVVPRLAGVAAEARSRWPVLARVAMLHRVGPLSIGEAAVVVAVSSPHRDAAFDACRWCIDSLKSTVPIWKRETWDGGESWGLDAQHVVDVDGSADVDAPVDRAGSAGTG